MTRKEAIEKLRNMNLPKETMEILEVVVPELAEKDDKIRESLISLIETISDYYISKETRNGYVVWLKSHCSQKLDVSKLENYDPIEVLNRIKTEWPMAWEKVVGKQGWSEKDEKMREKLINFLGSSLVPLTYKEWSEYRFWLQNLCPSWKPSEKQMNVLRKYISGEWKDITFKDDEDLISLYVDLVTLYGKCF